VLTLPEALEEDYHRAIQAIEEAEHMHYVTTAERIGMRKGHQEGLDQGLASERRLLLRQVTRRYGAAAAEQSAPFLARLARLDTLEQLGEGLVDSADSAAWLAVLSKLMPTT
jgi:flagellar biosynthesis/type III secretory pathway protein FliH